MFDETSLNPENAPLGEVRAVPDALKKQRLESAALWVKQRRAKLPRLSARRLPAVVVAV